MKRPNEPQPDPSRHLSTDCLQEVVLSSRMYTERLDSIIHRKSDGSRQCVDSCWLDIERGVVGDRWELSEKRKRDEQIAVMSTPVALAIANGQELELFGDNLFIDADLGDSSLPIGARFRLGDAVLEVSPESHDGCSKFCTRFGAPALKITATPANKHLRLRGVYLFVVQSGKVSVGDLFQRCDDIVP